MSVYVDDLAPLRCRIDCRLWGCSNQGCHMIADSVEELVEFGARIGLKRSWLQGGNNGRTPHFDLTAGKRRQAVAAGARELGRDEFVTVLRRIRAPARSRGG